MPELPEVETIVRGLRPHLIGRRIKTLDICTPSILLPEPGVFQERLPGRTILNLQRHGKYIFFVLSGRATIALHLRMTGQLTLQSGAPDRHNHFSFTVEGGQTFFYRDVRRFGRFTFIDSDSPADYIRDKGLGPDALGSDSDLLWLRFASRKRQLKALLLDQSFIAGLGNIYTDEILFATGHRPDKRSDRLGRRQFGSLVERTNMILNEAISHGGTTFSDYRGSTGKPGAHQLSLQVFNRAGEPCLRCGQVIEKMRVAGRGTYICSNCQSP